MKIKTLSKGLVIAISLGVVLFGVIAYAATSNILAVGTIPHSELFGGPAKVTFRNLITPRGEVGSWHYHPGKVFNVVKRGTVMVEDGCGEIESFTAEQAFEKIDGRVHRALNLGPEDAEEYNVFINPQDTPLTVFIPNNERRCGPPRTVNDCKDDGWVMSTHPRSVSDQGDCVQYVRHPATDRLAGSRGPWSVESNSGAKTVRATAGFGSPGSFSSQALIQ
jgi:hypothetical protein